MLKFIFCISLLILICNNYVFGDVVSTVYLLKLINNKYFKTQFCDNYAKCLEQLEEKQRECRESFALRRKVLEESDDDSKCSKKRNHDLHYEITALNLRKTENIRDCIQENLENAEEIKTADAVRLFYFV